jgi:exopolysaccharide biosynthesis polyprenyl glycosylphosphotransferase
LRGLSDFASDRVTAPSPSVRGIAALRHLASTWRFIACVQAIDFLIFFAAGVLWLSTLAQATAGKWLLMQLFVATLAAAMIHCVFQCFRLYDFAVLARGPAAAARALFAGGMSVGPFMASLLIQPDPADSSSQTASALLAAGCAGAALLRLPLATLAKALQRAGVVGRRVYIIADHPVAAGSLATRLERTADNRVVGIWCLSYHAGPIEAALEGALAFLRHNPVDAVILKLTLSQPDRLVQAAGILRRLPRPILLAPTLDSGADLVLDRGTAADGPGDTMLIQISDRPLAGWRWVRKDLQDRLLALFLLFLVSPAMVMIAIAIKISDPGPVFFRQKRRGYDGGIFDIIKFRTMRVAPLDTKTLKLTTRNDPRIFPVGRLLRRTSMDELPQLLNVLRGDMWLIGPRPHSPLAQAGGKVYADALQEYAARYRVKPGITGWAQVCGRRGPTETLDQLRSRVEHDLHYIENWSVFFDARILLKTVTCLFNNENAF